MAVAAVVEFPMAKDLLEDIWSQKNKSSVKKRWISCFQLKTGAKTPFTTKKVMSFPEPKMTTPLGLEPRTFRLGGERPTIGLRGQSIVSRVMF